MHGAITAEALRVPWMPAITSHEILESKWHDWAASMETEIQFRKLPTIWGQPQPSLRGRLAARLKASAFSRRLARMAKSTHFQLGSDAILEDRLRRIEARIQDFNSSFPG